MMLNSGIMTIIGEIIQVMLFYLFDRHCYFNCFDSAADKVLTTESLFHFQFQQLTYIEAESVGVNPISNYLLFLHPY